MAPEDLPPPAHNLGVTFYHGTTKSYTKLKAGSWLTLIPNHAIEQVKKRAKERNETPYILVLNANETEVRRPTEQDRNHENINNDLSQEGWVWISTTDLSVLERLDLNQAEKRFNIANTL
jgi:hypothetical protein